LISRALHAGAEGDREVEKGYYFRSDHFELARNSSRSGTGSAPVREAGADAR
jgi:hypothetical protein